MTEFLNEIAILLLYVIAIIGYLLDRVRDQRDQDRDKKIETLEKAVNGILGAQWRELDRMLKRSFELKKEEKEDYDDKRAIQQE